MRGSKRVRSCALLTTDANEVVRAYHDRMPVILPGDAYAEWLDPATPFERLTALLKPYPADEMRAIEANPRVNSPKHDGPECLEA